MKLIRGTHNLPTDLPACVMTIGNFDGLHLGHQQLISECVVRAKQSNLPSVLMTFEPYPQAFFSRDTKFPRLMSLRDKYLSLQDSGIDYLCVLRFDAKIAALSAESFVEDILARQFHVKSVVVGDDFRFGAKRVGDFKLLEQLGNIYGFETTQMPTYVYQKQRVSSSWLREALGKGNLDTAKALLGRPYCLSGQIVKGDQRGQEFGFPTANIYAGQKKLPLSGIFVVEVEGLEKTALPGVASVGYRPMYPTERDVLEVFLLDFNEDIYKQHCTVTFLKYLRGEKNFLSESELIAQIKEDVRETENYFS